MGKSLAAGGTHLFLLSVLVFLFFVFGQLPRQLLRAIQEVAGSLIKLTANASWQLILSAAQKYLGERPSVARAGHMEMAMNVVYGIYGRQMRIVFQVMSEQATPFDICRTEDIKNDKRRETKAEQ